MNDTTVQQPFQVMDRVEETLKGLIKDLEDLRASQPIKLQEVIKNMRLALAELRTL